MITGGIPMIKTRKRLTALFLALTLGSVIALAQDAATGDIVSDYTLGAVTLSSRTYSLSLTVAYPDNLDPSSYITVTQLVSDIQAFLTAYPSLQNPPEAILSSILGSLLQKYPQMTGGQLSAGSATGTSQYVIIVEK